MLRKMWFPTLLLALPAVASGQNTAFTYQGQLKQNNSHANGNFNMTFKLFDVVTAGAQQGSTLTFDGAGGNPPAVAVSSGLFTVSLDFGVGPFVANAPRWLEIAVNGNTLTPRQPLTPTPFALNTRGVNVDAAGKVGVGTAAPAQKLSVVGTIQSTSGGFMFPDGSTQTTAATGGGINFWSLNGSHIFKNNAGNVGIGTSSPAAPLHVLSNTTSSTDNTATFSAPGIGPFSSHIHYGATGDWYIRSAAASGKVVIQDAGGSVGIGTPTPSYPLTIKTVDSPFVAGYGWVHTDGTRELGSFLSSSGGWLGTKSNDPLHFFTNNSSEKMTLSTTGNLGIGTTTPGMKLDVNGRARLRNSVDGTAGLWMFNNTDRAFIGMVNNDHVGFWGNGGIGWGLIMNVNDGKVGIGVTPETALHVNGTTRTNVLEIVGADVAERFPTQEKKVEPGTVMEIDPDHPGKLRVARGEYNTRVAGVVSGAGDLQAGAVLGHMPGNEDAPPIALSGRVWVKSDASSAAINIGDMLTTSNTSGHAMKVSDRERSAGAIIGKAMTKLAKGENGLVLVLVNLQ